MGSELKVKILIWGSDSGRSANLLMHQRHKHFIHLNHSYVRLCVVLYAMDVAIACLRRVIRPILHHIRLSHNFLRPSIGYCPICNFSLSGGDTIQPSLLETGPCHRPSFPGQSQLLRPFRHKWNYRYRRLHQI